MVVPATMPQQVTANRPSVADHVFEELRRQVLSLELPPGARISEVEVARSMDVSRQPVRDEFYRLSKLGFLTIRPQRATTVSLISPAAVMQARFIRTALEVETVTHAATALSTADLDVLEGILDQQRQVVDPEHRAAFHRLDDLFHYEICARARGVAHGPAVGRRGLGLVILWSIAARGAECRGAGAHGEYQPQ